MPAASVVHLSALKRFAARIDTETDCVPSFFSSRAIACVSTAGMVTAPGKENGPNRQREWAVAPTPSPDTALRSERFATVAAFSVPAQGDPRQDARACARRMGRCVVTVTGIDAGRETLRPRR